jgi:hypothetical protein
MKVFLDDERETPLNWVRTYTVEETIEVLKTRQVSYLSLDNDLGEGKQEGFKCIDWIEEMVYFDKTFPIPILTVHSANPSRAQYMRQVIGRLEQIRQEQIGGE